MTRESSGPGKVRGGSESQPPRQRRDSSELPLCEFCLEPRSEHTDSEWRSCLYDLRVGGERT